MYRIIHIAYCNVRIVAYYCVVDLNAESRSRSVIYVDLKYVHAYLRKCIQMYTLPPEHSCNMHIYCYYSIYADE